MDFVKSVVEFNRLAGTEEVYNEQMLSLYVGLIFEEFQELLNGLKIRPSDVVGDQYKCEMLENCIRNMNLLEGYFKRNEFSRLLNVNHKEVLDGAIDIAVVALGAGIANGSDVSGAANEICESNMSKAVEIDGKMMMLKNQNGKILKPETYRKPNLTPFVSKNSFH